jgi:hypothetical protein
MFPRWHSLTSHRNCSQSVARIAQNGVLAAPFFFSVQEVNKCDLRIPGPWVPRVRTNAKAPSFVGSWGAMQCSFLVSNASWCT